jgi:hypothetical protein
MLKYYIKVRKEVMSSINDDGKQNYLPCFLQELFGVILYLRVLQMKLKK